MFAIMILVLVFLVKCFEASYILVDNSTASAYPCKNTKNFITSYDINQKDIVQFYNLYMHIPAMRAGSFIRIRFNNDVNATLAPTGSAKLTQRERSYISIDFTREKRGALGVYVAGIRAEYLPYILSIVINGDERCTEPNPGVFDELFIGQKHPQEIVSDTGPTCGRRQLLHTELITHSILTKPGDWPWHAAIYRMEKHGYDYKCGGTLISKTFVLTAAHCLMIRGSNKVFPKKKVKVYLGKYNLHGQDYNIQERKISEIIIHPRFNYTNVNNDISLIRLNAEAEFNDIVQPACIWNPEVINKLENARIHGTVVGWGFDENDRLSSELRQATIPMVDALTCVFSNHIFFGKYLNPYKFCAGYNNGTSACNGDSGGGFVVFIPDETSSKQKHSHLAGSWYVRGIVSVAISRRDANICERNSYVLFTDVAKYREWINRYMNTVLDKEEPDMTDEPIPDSESIETMSIYEPPIIIGPTCGRRQLLHVELITNSELAKPGDFPWHAAVYLKDRINLNYQCGGTLISKNVVITSAVCTSNRNNKTKSFVVSLGKYRLLNIEDRVQSREVAEVVIHENFNLTNQANDIALLKMRKDVVYGDYIQPACLWNRETENYLPRSLNYMGSVAGWGFNENQQVSSELRATSMPIISDEVCLLQSPIFTEYGKGKFCAGFANGTSPCNGDSGGGFMVFVSQTPQLSGVWYLRGIVSAASTTNDTRRCDAHNYVLYTDLALYMDWIQEVMLSRWIF